MKKYLLLVVLLFGSSAYADHWPTPPTTDCGYYQGECEDAFALKLVIRRYVESKFSGQHFLNHIGEWYAGKGRWNNMWACKRTIYRWRGKLAGVLNDNETPYWEVGEEFELIVNNANIPGCIPTSPLPQGNPPPPFTGGGGYDN